MEWADPQAGRAASLIGRTLQSKIPSLLARWVIAVNDLVQKRAVGCALGFFQDAARVVVLVTALEPNTTIRSGNFSGREPASVVELITNRLTYFAIRICCRGHYCVLCIIEVVNGARAIWMH